MTNSPQIPEDVREAIQVFRLCVAKQFGDEPGDTATRTHVAYELLITAIAAHLRPVVQDKKVSNSTPLIEVEKLVDDLKSAAISYGSNISMSNGLRDYPLDVCLSLLYNQCYIGDDHDKADERTAVFQDVFQR